MEPGAELANQLADKRRELAAIERQLAEKPTARTGLVPGPGYGQAKDRLSEEIRQLTTTSARLQRDLRALMASLQPKLL